MMTFRQALITWSPLALLASLSIIGLSGCEKPQAEGGQASLPEVVTTSPIKFEMVEWDEYVGRLSPTDFVEVRSRVSGYLSSTNFVEGQIVKQNDLLCVIDQRPFLNELRRAQSDIKRSNSQVKQAQATSAQAEAELQAAQSRLALAEKQLVRSKTLVDQRAASQDDFEVRDSEVSQAIANVKAAEARLQLTKTAITSAQSAVNTAETNLAVAQLNLEYTEVRAPITGRVSSRRVTEGNLISGGEAGSTLITTIVSLNPIYCEFDTDEMSYLRYDRLAREGKLGSSRQIKHPVYVALANEGKTFPHTGHMDFVDNQLDPLTGTMRCRAILSNDDHSLTPGLFTRVRIPGSELHEAILIPDLCVGTAQADKFVFVLNEKNEVERRIVTLGSIVRGLRLIKSGLTGDERLVYKGLQRVRGGETVESTHEKVEISQDELPLDHSPVPEDKWISRESPGPIYTNPKPATQPATVPATGATE
ncbi:efflux RND transporter periplasmic adaptor subunit [Planctomicrobium sp. SH668]|uniref:efflux RND transporter periplasmic adaptor subunit n=1 Tax=Planctomicrobium sp. SH668 TaxID=3448126 RepID=UPI003F5C72D6